MLTACDLIVVRHGRTAWNEAHRYQGQTDIPLDETGIEQATAVRRALSGECIDAAFASDLSRARTTAEIVIGERPIALELDVNWREMQFGAWEGLTWPQIQARHPNVVATSPREVTPEGGESFDELCTRIALAVSAILARVPNGSRVLVATHAGPLHALMRVVLGESTAAALGVRFSPASVTRLRYDAGAWTLGEINRVHAIEAAPTS